MHGFGAQALPELPYELLPQQLNLLSALRFDPFQLGVGLGTQLLGDLLGVMTRLLDHLLRLGLGFFECLGVLGIRVGHLLFRFSVLFELSADSLLLALHHAADRRHDVFHEEKDDDREADELSDECRHLTTALAQS